MNLATIRQRLQAYRPSVVDHQRCGRAAVAMLLRERGGACDVLLIQRSERSDDPWSGHMALPGGRHHPEDRDLWGTAARETHEEVGIDLTDAGDLIGHLDDIQAVARDRPLGLIIRPYVYALDREVFPKPDGREVSATVWLPLPYLIRSEAKGTHIRRFNGVTQEFPAFVYEGYTVWGLTYQMLTGFLALVR